MEEVIKAIKLETQAQTILLHILDTILVHCILHILGTILVHCLVELCVYTLS